VSDASNGKVSRDVMQAMRHPTRGRILTALTDEAKVRVERIRQAEPQGQPA
jgi:hypothetical protein